jgi:hypothetical protein
MLYRTSDGIRLEASTAADLIRELRSAVFSPSEDESSYMRACASRALNMGIRLHVDTPESFVADLLRYGALSYIN